MSRLPESWVSTSLGDVIAIRNGYAFKSVDFRKDGVPVVKQSNLTGRLVDLSDCVFVPNSVAEQASNFRIKFGDILLGMSGSIGEPSVYRYECEAVQNQRTGLVLFSVDDEGHRKFITFALILFERDYAERGKGIGVQNVSAKDIESTVIPLPPILEQRRIVAKVESLSAKSRRAHDHLDHVPRLVEKYKQAILAAAFSGKLTLGWRNEAGARTEPWSEVSLGDIAQIGTGSTPKRGEQRYYSGGHIPWITSGAVNESTVKSAEEFITDAALRETNCKVFAAGTLLMAMYGEGQTRGRVAVLGIDAATNQALAAIQITPNSPAVRDFVLWYLRMNYLELRHMAAGGVQPNLNLGIIKALQLSLPPRREQEEIVRRVAIAFSWIDRLASETTSASRLIDHLDQSILAKAFRGELEPQDPNDEPASILLERIKAERGAPPEKKRKKAMVVAAR